MKKITSYLFLAFAILMISSCGIKGHNNKNLGKTSSNEERVYGDKTAPPRQLKNKFDDDGGKTAARINEIKDKLYPN